LLETLDGDRGCVVPEPFPDFAELAVTQLADELEARSVDLPLVAGRVRQVGSHRFLDLKKDNESDIYSIEKCVMDTWTIFS
jgi:hypothetical protein